MVFENFGVLNRVRARKVQRHVPIETDQGPVPPLGMTEIYDVILETIYLAR